MTIDFEKIRADLFKKLNIVPSPYEGKEPECFNRIYDAVPYKSPYEYDEAAVLHEEQAEEIELEYDAEDIDLIPSALSGGDEAIFIVAKYRHMDWEYWQPWIHLTECKYINNTRSKESNKITPRTQKNFQQNFYITTRHDGKFKITDVYTNGHNKRTYKDELYNGVVCEECFRLLNLRKQFRKISKFDFNEYYWKNSFTGKRYLQKFEKPKKKKSGGRYSYSFRTFLAPHLKQLRNNTCEICHRVFQTDYLEVHHKDKNKSNNSIENLMVICEYCHDEFHPNRPGADERRRKKSKED